MIKTYLASPGNQTQADKAKGMPVLFSFAGYKPWLDGYQQTFSSLLIDSGAYSEFTTGKQIDLSEYKRWCARWNGHPAIDAIAGLDDISGDWRKSLKNYEEIGFPTFHISDPEELLDDLVDIAKERGNWMGIGLIPGERAGKEEWLRKTLDRIPEDIHIHGWAMRAYRHLERFDSMDSTNWFRDPFKLNIPALAHLTYAERLEIVVKRYKREGRVIRHQNNEKQGDFQWS